jgi:quinol monooxygenase YgiN
VVSRVNFLEAAPERIEDVARVVRDIVHPGIREEGGYVGYIVLGDRETGRVLGVTLWENGEAREASDATARQIRPRSNRRRAGRCGRSKDTTSCSSTFEPSSSLVVGGSRVFPSPAPMCAMSKGQDTRLPPAGGSTP